MKPLPSCGEYPETRPKVGADGPSGPAPAVRLVPVDERSEGQRLDNFLARECRGVPRGHLHRVIREGQVRVNGRRAKSDTRLAVGDTVRIPPLRTDAVAFPGRMSDHERARGARKLAVLFEDDSLLVVDKPAGLAVHGGSGIDAGVIEMLRAARPEQRFLELVHRIDRDTSGILMLAKRRQALVGLHAQLRERAAGKDYVAIVQGRLPLRSRTIAAPLRRYLTAEGERRVAVDPAHGQEALTRVQGLAHASLALGEFTRVACRIETGRTHQIRVHLAHIGHPVAGDPKYADFALGRALARAGHGRMFLHAAAMTVRHPASGAILRLVAPVPAQFDALVPPPSTPRSATGGIR
ncbi:MAG: RluA family pseudouridine synthase [Burkholderiaceae bacterium]